MMSSAIVTKTDVNSVFEQEARVVKPGDYVVNDRSLPARSGQIAERPTARSNDSWR